MQHLGVIFSSFFFGNFCVSPGTLDQTTQDNPFLQKHPHQYHICKWHPGNAQPPLTAH